MFFDRRADTDRGGHTQTASCITISTQKEAERRWGTFCKSVDRARTIHGKKAGEIGSHNNPEIPLYYRQPLNLPLRKYGKDRVFALKKLAPWCTNQDPARVISIIARSSSTGTAPGMRLISVRLVGDVLPATINAGVPLISNACIAE